MPLDFNIQPPAWLTEAGQWTDREGLAAFQVGANIALQRQKMALDAQAQKVDLAAKMQAMDLQHQTLVNSLSGGIEVGDWIKQTGSDPAKMVDTPYTGTNPFAAKQIEAMQSAARQSTIVKTKQKAAELAAENDAKASYEFQQGLSTVPLPDQVRIKSMSTGAITPEQVAELNTVRQSNGMLPIGAKKSDFETPESPLGKLISDRDAAQERGDVASVASFNKEIERVSNQTQGPPVRERKLLDLAKELQLSGDTEGASSIRQVAFHQWRKGIGALVTPEQRGKIMKSIQELSVPPANETDDEKAFREKQVLELKLSLHNRKPAPAPLNQPSPTSGTLNTNDPLGILK